MRNAPILYASSNGARVGKGPPLSQRLEEAAVGGLAAWVRSRVKMYESLRAALGKLGDPQEVLLQELPGVVLTELAELNAAYSDSDKFAEVHHKVSERGVHRYLTNRVSDHLRALGGEATTSRKRAEEPAQAEADYALDGFVLQETVRQQLDALEEAAGLATAQEGRGDRRDRRRFTHTQEAGFCGGAQGAQESQGGARGHRVVGSKNSPRIFSGHVNIGPALVA